MAYYTTLAPWRVLVIDKCGSAAPRRRQAHAVKRARRAENESEAESPAEPLGRPSAFSLSRSFPSSLLLRFSFRLFSLSCVATARFRFRFLLMPQRGDANRVLPCRIAPKAIMFFLPQHLRKVPFVGALSHSPLKSKRTEILAVTSDISDNDARIFFSR